MKLPRTSLLILGIGLACSSVKAQSTLVLSNLDEPPDAIREIASDSWVATRFATGDNPEGYFLDSVQLAMEEASGLPDGFTLSLYGLIASGTENPIKIADLSGFEPSNGGVFSYDAVGVTLEPSTDYSIVASAATTAAAGTYRWAVSSTSHFASENGWSIGAINWQSSDGISWDVGTRSRMQYAINATAIPEPSTLALLGCGVVLAAGRVRRAMKQRRTE